MKTFRVFFVISDPADNPPSRNLVTATNLFTEYIFCESVHSRHKSRSSSSFQEAVSLVKLIEVNTDNSNDAEHKFIPYRAAQKKFRKNEIFVCRSGGNSGVSWFTSFGVTKKAVLRTSSDLST